MPTGDAKRRSRVIVIAAVVVALACGYVLFFKPNRPALPQGTEVTFEIASGERTARIAADLKRAGLIDNALVFQFRLLLSGTGTTLKAGTHRLSAGMDYDRLILALRQSPSAPAVKVTIPEGSSIPQIAAVLQDKLGIDAGDFTTYASGAAPDFVARFPFLAGVYRNSLEGYLFPDTYLFAKDATSHDICVDMLARFNQVWSSLDPSSGGPYSMAQLITIASLVEKEVAVPAERPLVSSVIYNRLQRDMKLQLCSSVQFLLPGPAKNKLRLTNEDLATPSPYNTYLNAGLPPGPISNPGKAALQAALKPAKTDYLYFVLTGKDGSQTFASTLTEFEVAKARSKEVFGQ